MGRMYELVNVMMSGYMNWISISFERAVKIVFAGWPEELPQGTLAMP